jgi:5'-nucleotidase / UDP-sugar diphosphatase
MKRLLAVVTLLLVSLFGVMAQESFSLTILHTSDTHAHHEAVNGNGGVARQATVVNQIRAEGGNVLLVDTGDRFSGTLFHTLYQGADQVQVMTALGYDAFTLGNHEFDEGDATLAAFLGTVGFPTVVSNIDVSASPELKDIIKPYAIVDVNGEKVGLLGLILAETPSISSPSAGIVFSNDYANIANQTAETLLAEGVNKIILLAHIGYQADLDLLPQLKNIDVVVGGNTDDIFSNTLQVAVQRYPFVGEDAEGKPIYYVQAGSDNLYLGRLDVTFDAEGVVTSVAGDAILLSRYISPDPVVANLVAQLAVGVEELEQTSIGAETIMPLEGSREVCRAEECSLGSILADSMRLVTGAEIALANGGGVRASLDAGDITVGEIMAVQPFGNIILTFDINGGSLRQALENGVSRVTLNADGQIDRTALNGRFLQVSGLRYSYDPRKEVGSRIISVEVENADGTYSPLVDTQVYRVATNNFLVEGGDGYSVLAENARNVAVDGQYDYEVLTDYLVFNTPIDESVLGTEPRITLILE